MDQIQCFKITYGMESWCSTCDATVVYKIGEFVEAPEYLASQGYHLLVFDSLRNAMDWGRYCYGTNKKLWKVIGEGVVEPLPHRADSYERADLPIQIIPGETWPKGTKMVKRAKLLELVRPRWWHLFLPLS